MKVTLTITGAGADAAQDKQMKEITQAVITCLKLTIETLEKGVKYVQSKQ